MKNGSLPAAMALRYLRAPKSHSAVSAIAAISVAGVAVATAAIVCVLSVFNGFRGLLSDNLDRLAPDVLVAPAAGKTFADADSVAALICGVEGVERAVATVTDNALAIFDSREMPVTLRGADLKAYAAGNSADSLTVAGKLISELSPGEAAIAPGIAAQVGAGLDDHLFLFAPRREGRVNLANPLASFLTDSVRVASVFQSLQNEYDENTVFCDIAAARELFQYTTEATAFEVKGKPGTDPAALGAAIARRLGPSADVRDRMRQQEAHFRMVSIEKWMTFLLLIFILLIASFNIISTLCMLILEKQRSMATLAALGMTRRRIARIFWWESLYVSLSGGLCGIALGVGLCLLQQRFGLIKLGGDPATLIVKSYPVAVEWTDLLIAFAPVLAIGLATAFISAAFARSRAKGASGARA